MNVYRQPSLLGHHLLQIGRIENTESRKSAGINHNAGILLTLFLVFKQFLISFGQTITGMHPSVCSLTVVYLIMNTLFIEILRIADNFLVENIIFAYTKPQHVQAIGLFF